MLCYRSILLSPLPLPLPLLATRHSPLATRHSPPPQPQSLRGFIVVVVVIIIIVIVIVIITGDDLFDCCVCSVIVSSPLPHPVVAIPPTASAIVVVVVVVVVAYYPPLRVICLIVVCACPCPLLCRLPVAPPRPSTSCRLLIVDSIVNGVVVATWPLRWIIFGRNCSRRRSRRGGRRGRIVVVISPSPSFPAEDQRAEACGRGPRLSPSLRWWLVATMACRGGWRGGNGSLNRYHRLVLIVMLHGSVKIGL